MSQQVKVPGYTCRSDAFSLLLNIVRGTGYCLAFVGWALFAIGVFCLADAGPSHWIEEPFRWGSHWVVPGWLLLRLAAGLFPFSVRFVYRQPKS